ncbi:MAG: class I SAM-dependent methyltransferase [Candidatus Veblenbacteria bacterium]|nr:class I SAM-dependent methyltransferase [Candidatus Veblenbacteria bacterium]
MEELEKEPSTRDKTDEEVFQTYIEDLRLTPEDFDKKILDVGAGAAQFAKWAKEHGVSGEIYNLEPQKEYILEKNKSVVARAEAIPFEDESFDLVVSNAAIPNIYISEVNADTVKEKVMNSLYEMVRVIRPGGEVRLSRVLMDKGYESKQILPKSIGEALENLKTKGNVQIEKIRTPSDDTYEYENNQPKRLLAETYLIIIHKQAK